MSLTLAILMIAFYGLGTLFFILGIIMFVICMVLAFKEERYQMGMFLWIVLILCLIVPAGLIVIDFLLNEYSYYLERMEQMGLKDKDDNEI